MRLARGRANIWTCTLFAIVDIETPDARALFRTDLDIFFGKDELEPVKSGQRHYFAFLCHRRILRTSAIDALR